MGSGTGQCYSVRKLGEGGLRTFTHARTHAQQFLRGPLVVEQPVDHLQPQKMAHLNKTQVFSVSSFLTYIHLATDVTMTVPSTYKLAIFCHNFDFLLLFEVHKEVFDLSLI